MLAMLDFAVGAAVELLIVGSRVGAIVGLVVGLPVGSCDMEG